MPLVTTKDADGFTLEVYQRERGPSRYAAKNFNWEIIENMPDYPLRDDDMMICSYIKSGCRWVWELTRMLRTGHTELAMVDKEVAMLELHTVWADIEATNEPRILNNHQFFDMQPKDLMAKNLKVVLVYRNPKDVAVSYFHHVKSMEHFYSYEGDFNAFLKRFAEGNLDNNSMFDYLKGWEQGIKDNPSLDVLVLSYDELRHDPLPHLRALAKFLGKDWGDSFLETVINNTDIEIMQKLKGLWKSDDDGVAMHRKGQVGDWKNHFTVAQSEWFEQIINDAMKNSKLFTFKYTL